METEHHLYTSCHRLEQFWRDARNWAFIAWGIVVPLNLKCSRLFGMEKERPEDLFNIFYRNVRYTISAATRHQPSLDMLEDLLLDDLKRQYAGKRVEKCINNEEEQLAIAWFRNKLSLDPIRSAR